MERIGTVFTADCSEMNEMGAGIVRYEGLVVFVPGLVPGDRAEIEIVSAEKNYAIGKCLSLVCQSPFRIPSRCPEEERCGGCTLGHIPYDMENRIKQNTVRSAFRRAGLKEIPLGETIYGEYRYGYRNKMTLRYDPASRCFGYCREGSDEVLSFRGCPLCPDRFSEIVLFLNRQPDLTAPLRPNGLCVRSGSEGLSLSIRTEYDPEDPSALLTAIREAFPDVVLISVSGSVQDAAPVRDRIAGLEMAYSGDAFRQVNTPVFEKLLDLLTDMAGEVPFERAADLYCGSGVIGLALARAFPSARITGVEINPDAVEDAKKNAARNGLGNIRFFAGDAASFRKRTGDRERPSLVTVDPPRAGLSRQMRRELTYLAPERILYVSCNPQTLARDVRELTEAGYAVGRVVPVNMFPATKHVESVVKLTRAGL